MITHFKARCDRRSEFKEARIGPDRHWTSEEEGGGRNGEEGNALKAANGPHQGT